MTTKKDSLMGKLVFLIFLIAIMLPAMVIPVRAENLVESPIQDDEVTVCNQAEIVFLIDQSGSMWGSEDHPRPNDPLNLRSYGPIFASRALNIDSFLMRNVPGQNAWSYSLAVINFASNARAVNFSSSSDFPQYWVSLSPTDESSMSDINKLIEEKISSFTPGGDLGVNTNFSAAFEIAEDLYSKRDPSQGGCPRRAIILLTEGMPYVEEKGFSYSTYLKDLQENVVLNYFPKEDYDIYVTGINDPDSPEYWDKTKTYWESITNDSENLAVRRSQMTYSGEQVSERINAIIQDIKQGAVKPVQVGPFAIPPYLQEFDLVFFKSNENEVLQVTDPAGNRVEPNGTTIQSIGLNEPIEILRVNMPQPGTWNFATSANRTDVKLNLIQIPASGILLRPSGNEALRYQRTSIQFQLVDANGNPLPKYNDTKYDLKVDATVTANGRSWPVSFREEPNRIYVADFIPSEAGQYTLDVAAQSMDEENNAIEVVQGTIGQFFVGDVKLEQVTGPDTIKPCGPQANVPFPISYALIGPDGKPVLSENPVRWDVTVDSEVSSIPINMSGPDKDGYYAGTVLVNEPGTYALKTKGSLVEAQGVNTQVLADSKDSFVIQPAKLLDVKWLQPTGGIYVGDKLILQKNFPFIGLKPTDLPLEVQVITVDDSQPLDLAKLSKEVNNLLVAELQNTATGEVFHETTSLSETGVQGVLKGKFTSPGLGKYVMQIKISDQANYECGYALQQVVSTTNLQVIHTWLLWALLGIAAIIVGFLIYVIISALMSFWPPLMKINTVFRIYKPDRVSQVPGEFRYMTGHSGYRGFFAWRVHDVRVGTRKICLRTRKEGNGYVVEFKLHPNKGRAQDWSRISPGEMRMITNNFILYHHNLN